MSVAKMVGVDQHIERLLPAEIGGRCKFFKRKVRAKQPKICCGKDADKPVRKRVKSGDFYVHELGIPITRYCGCGIGLENKTESPAHLKTLGEFA
jgi:hypothetical protein